MTFEGQTVLVTGGTAGIGLQTALCFGSLGAQTVLTYAWGSADEDAVRAQFADEGAPAPLFVHADVGRAEDTEALMERLREVCDGVHAFISNASVATTPRSLDDYDMRALLQGIGASAWPVVGYTKALRSTFGAWPRYVVAMSSDGPDRFSVGYDFVASSKAVLETLVRYLTWHLRDEEVCINALRSRGVRTASFEATFGRELGAVVRALDAEHRYVPAVEVARAAVALCSGLMDAVNGQVLTIDRGTAFSDNLQRIYEARTS
ncbi:MAG: SDR family oxidoreductase [Nannocystaceae bacterium]|nr:SDR family oxidoreductase [bacterium]